MGITIKTSAEIADEYLLNLKALKPEINTDQEDSQWAIESKVIGGVISGVYADLNAVSNDAFPQSARNEAINNHLITWTGAGLRQATNAQGLVLVTGATGTIVLAGTQFIHSATQNVYTSSSQVTVTAASGAEIPVTSVVTGQDQNLLTSTVLTISSPPAGLLSIGTAVSPGITDGRDIETTEEGAARVLAIIRSQKRGATESDYIAWALTADARVTSAKINRFPYGLGTVGVVITSGTTDINTAVDNDQTINFQPSVALLAVVTTYIEAVKPLTDTIYVTGVTQNTKTVAVQVRWVTGDKNSIVPGTTVTQGTLLQREINRAIYNTPIGGIIYNLNGYLFASAIEKQIDTNLNEFTGALYQIIRDREVTDVAGGGYQVTLTSSEKALPGTITITEL